MKTFTNIEDIRDIPPTAIALGNFDGVHLGHAALIARMVEYASAHGLAPAVFTFSNQPRNVIRGREDVRSLITQEEKTCAMRTLGVARMFSFPFDARFHGMTPDAFIGGLLLDSFDAKAVFCGFNFRFGANAAGHTSELKAAATAKGFDLEVMEPYRIDGTLVSSTLIRRLIGEGKVREAAKFLGRPFAIEGETGRGRGIGRTLGFPTANIDWPDGIVRPARGVYVTDTELEGRMYRSVTNAGRKPTVGGTAFICETHVFGVSDTDLYGKRFRVSFLDMLRPEKKFDGLESLRLQVEADKRAALAKNKKRQLRCHIIK
jgi:riboflavin kinase/FMN adenylyltransferase